MFMQNFGFLLTSHSNGFSRYSSLFRLSKHKSPRNDDKEKTSFTYYISKDCLLNQFLVYLYLKILRKSIDSHVT